MLSSPDAVSVNKLLFSLFLSNWTPYICSSSFAVFRPIYLKVFAVGAKGVAVSAT